MSPMEIWTTRALLLLASLSLPVVIFYPQSPNVTYTFMGLLSLMLVLVRKQLSELKPVLKNLWTYLAFILWAIIACLWSITPEESLRSVAKLPLVILAAISFYVAHTIKIHDRFMQVYKYGYYVALFLLILDEILQTHILRSLRGQSMETPEYYHGVTLLVLSLWPILNDLKTRHPSIQTLLIGMLLLGVFKMDDHAAKLALVIGLLAWIVTYLSPRIFISAAGIISVGFMLTLPFALKDMDPLTLIHSHQNLLMKPSYAHRLFILKGTNDMIFEQPWIGHGLQSYRKTTNYSSESPVHETLLETMKKEPGSPYDFKLLSLATHPHNLTLQIWLELGVVGVMLYAIFLLTSLWKIARLPSCRFEQSTFMGLFTSAFVIAHISFGAWETWWLIGLSLILAIQVWQLNNPKKGLE